MSQNPFGRDLPVTVMLRNRKTAVVEQIVEDTAPFVLLGRLRVGDPAGHVVGKDCEHLGDHQLWRRNGRWLEGSAPHLFDIVGLVIAQAGDQVTFVPLAAAAGAMPGGQEA